jgi:hypothetical protein
LIGPTNGRKGERQIIGGTIDEAARRRARRILGVEDDASPDRVRRAWLKLCRETHPDRNPGDRNAGERFRRAHGAYRLLTKGTPCEELQTSPTGPAIQPAGPDKNMTNPWGYYLWWCETFRF